MADPVVSVIMATYNCADTVEAALDSIAEQSYPRWEIVLCDDASTDDTYAILKQFAEAHPGRVILLRNEQNRKLPFSLNRCLEHASGELIARMDGDDISRPSRLERQVAFLEENPDVALVGTSMQRFNVDGFGDVVLPPERPNRWTLRSTVPFCHATIMARAGVYEELDGYTVSERTARCEDIDLWFRFFHHGFRGQNLPEPLYLVREDLAAIRRRTLKGRVNLYRTTLRGFRLLDYPRTWYLRPTWSLLKAVVPAQAVSQYRRWQGRHPHPQSPGGVQVPQSRAN
jgi:glycosyltransferase EpsE